MPVPFMFANFFIHLEASLVQLTTHFIEIKT